MYSLSCRRTRLLHFALVGHTAPHHASLCIEKKQPYCHYELKPPPKPRASKAARPRLSSHFSAEASRTVKRMAGQTAVYDTGGMLVAPGNVSAAMMQGTMALKRSVVSEDSICAGSWTARVQLYRLQVRIQGCSGFQARFVPIGGQMVSLA